MSIPRSRLFAFSLGAVVGAGFLLVVSLSMRRKELSGIRAELADRQSEVEALDKELGRRNVETHVLAIRVASLLNSLQSSDPDAEREMEDWILRASTLRRYIDSHPQLKIPEMHFLTTSDWLDAAKEKKFSSEADVRLALAFLRSVAKAKAGPTIATLLLSAQKDGASLPADLSTLTEDPLLKQILSRYSIFDPNKPPSGYWARGADTVVVETRFPEPGIDLPQWYTREGSFGVSGFSDEPLRAIGDAITQFRHDRGSAPRTLDDVRAYLKGIPSEGITQDMLDAVLRPAPSG